MLQTAALSLPSRPQLRRSPPSLPSWMPHLGEVALVPRLLTMLLDHVIVRRLACGTLHSVYAPRRAALRQPMRAMFIWD